jgi:hypothetical protein
MYHVRFKGDETSRNCNINMLLTGGTGSTIIARKVGGVELGQRRWTANDVKFEWIWSKMTMIPLLACMCNHMKVHSDRPETVRFSSLFLLRTLCAQCPVLSAYCPRFSSVLLRIITITVWQYDSMLSPPRCKVQTMTQVHCTGLDYYLLEYSSTLSPSSTTTTLYYSLLRVHFRWYCTALL